jgi:hypothetical protein
MPKLVKVNNMNQTDGQFENLFQEPITIEKNAKVALLNACVEIDAKNIKVNDSNNDGIEFKTAQGLPDFTTVNLINGVYYADELVAMVEARMNAGLEYKIGTGTALSTDVGFQWKVRLDAKNRVNIIYDRDTSNLFRYVGIYLHNITKS